MTLLGSKMESEIAEIPEMITRLSALDFRSEKLLELFNSKSISSVLILARGTSDNAAHFLKYLIETKIGMPCGLASPSAATLYEGEFKYKGVLVIAISQSGQSTDLTTFAEAAKNGGAFLLSITNDVRSPLAANSDIHLPILAGPEIAIPATKSYVGQLVLCYLLVMNWIGAKVDISEMINQTRKLLGQVSNAVSFAKEIDIEKPIAVLGRGFSFPNAKEFALKIQETCLVPVQGMSSSDYLHGPIAALHPGTQVIFMAPKHQPDQSFGAAVEKVRQSSAKILWLGVPTENIAGEVVLAGANCSDEILSSICDAVAFQLATLALARCNQLDPDSPQGLTKVTKTF